MANFSYVVNSKFDPLSREDIFTPLLIYKSAYDERQAEIDKIQEQMDPISYLAARAEENPNSKAGQIYKAYNDEFQKYANDFNTNGLNINNGRGLLALRRRAGEIKNLAEADKKLEKERERRLNNKDQSMIYSTPTEKLDIDMYLNGNTPDTYSISGNDLYTRGINAGKSYTSKFSDIKDGGNILGGYYKDLINTVGKSPELLAQFRKEILLNPDTLTALPELKNAAFDIMKSTGADKLTGDSYGRALANVVSGIVDGAIYQETHKPVDNKGVLSANESRRLALSEGTAGVIWDGEKYNKNLDAPKSDQLKYAGLLGVWRLRGHERTYSKLQNSDEDGIRIEGHPVYPVQNPDGSLTIYADNPHTIAIAKKEKNGNITFESLTQEEKDEVEESFGDNVSEDSKSTIKTLINHIWDIRNRKDDINNYNFYLNLDDSDSEAYIQALETKSPTVLNSKNGGGSIYTKYNVR